MITIRKISGCLVVLCLVFQMQAVQQPLQAKRLQEQRLQEQRFLGDLVAHIAYYFLGDVRAEYANHPYSTEQATVRFGYDVAPAEKVYVAQRLSKVEQALENLLDTQLADTTIPRIAFCCSGGGYRAMVGTLGALKGAQEIGLLDASMYAAGVSGSTWALAALTQSGVSPAECLEQITESIGTDLLDGYSHQQVTDALLKQIAFTKQFSLVDFYGALLAQKLLKKMGTADVNEITLASQAEKVATAEQIFPIYSAVMDCGTDCYEWVEFTPYEVGSLFLGAFIPTWAFGRACNAGVSTDYDPAQSLGFGMGMWGSAFTADLKEIAQSYLGQTQSSLIAYLLSQFVQDLPDFITEERFITPAKVANWTHGTTAPYAQHKHVQLVDAGFACNLPLLPLLRTARPVDIIIIVDANEVLGASELRIAEEYARAHTIAFPPIDYTKVNLPCSVHADWSDPRVPVIIYFPLVAQAGYQQGWNPRQNFTNTFNFSYTKDQAMLLSGLTEYAMVQSKQMIVDTILRVMA